MIKPGDIDGIENLSNFGKIMGFFTVYTFINLKATDIFISQSFVEKHWLNIYKLLWSIPIYDVSRTPNVLD